MDNVFYCNNYNADNVSGYTLRKSASIQHQRNQESTNYSFTNRLLVRILVSEVDRSSGVAETAFIFTFIFTLRGKITMVDVRKGGNRILRFRSVLSVLTRAKIANLGRN